MRVPIALTALVLVAVVSGAACAQARSTPKPSARMDAGLRRLAASGSDTIVGVFIRTAHPLSPRERRRLERAGARVGTITGHLLSARVAARRLRDVAGLPFVTYMEIAVPLRPQGAERPSASAPLSSTVSHEVSPRSDAGFAAGAAPRPARGLDRAAGRAPDH